MFDPILVPLDGSPLAECVLPHVVAMGLAFNTRVTLLHVLDKNRAGASAQLFDLINWQIDKTEEKLYLERIGDSLHDSGLQAHEMVLEGLVAETIAEFAHSQKIKLIILSSHGQSGFRKRGISSVTNKVILSAPASVLIARAPQVEERPYRRLLVPLDGSWRAENVLPVVTQLARYHGAQIHIAHVVRTPEMAHRMPPMQEDIDLSNRVVERNRDEAAHYLDQVRQRSPLAGMDVQTHLLVSDNPPLTLHELVDQQQIDLVVLSAHGSSENSQWPYGSMVNNFILYSTAPLLIVQDLPVREETDHMAATLMPVRENPEF